MSLPRLVAGPRRAVFARLLLNGLAQALAAFLVASLLHDALSAARSGVAGTAAARPATIAGLVGLGLAMLGLRALERVDAERLGQDYVMKVRLRLFDGVTALPARNAPTERFGLTMTRLVTDLNALRNWVSIGVARMAVAAVSLVGILGALAYFDPLAALVAGAVAVACGLSALALTPLLRGHVRESRRRRGRLAGNLGEKVFASGTVRHFGRAARERRRLRTQSRRLTDSLVGRMRIAGVLRSLPDAAFPVAVAALVLLLALFPGARAAGGGHLAVTMLLLGMLMSSLRDLAQAWDYRLSFQEGRRRIDQLLSRPRVQDAPGAADLPGAGPVSIELRDATVAGVLERVSVRAEAGERVLATGDTGSGKSTLVALLARLFDPDAGEVLLDGRPMRDLTLESIHRAVQLVSPALPLMRGTVAANIAYGLGRGEDPARVAEAAALCGLDAASGPLPRGLETPVKEKGENLPGGVRSRIALARALAGRPRLLLVDDPVFAVDAGARTALRRALAATRATVVLVGAGDDAPMLPDRVWCLEDGAVREHLPGPRPRPGADREVVH